MKSNIYNETKLKGFEDYFNSNAYKFNEIKFSQDDISKINTIVNVVVPAKKTEQHHIIDGKNEYKRFTTGFFGELAVEKLLNIKFIRYSSEHSNIYNTPDIEGLKVGIKTVEYGKFPIIFKKSYYPEIICVKKDENTVFVCGLATVDVLNKYQSDSLILSPLLKNRGTKTGFWGFDHLLPFNSLAELKKLIKK